LKQITVNRVEIAWAMIGQRSRDEH